MGKRKTKAEKIQAARDWKATLEQQYQQLEKNQVHSARAVKLRAEINAAQLLINKLKLFG